jgi:hypothetical protein
MAYDIFISYRRKGGFATANHLYNLLKGDGYCVSFDIDTLRSGNFDTELLKRIDECTDFILVLNPGAFDRCLDPAIDKTNDWLRNELAHALEKGKNIIPVMLDGFGSFPPDLPEDIAQVAFKNAPMYDIHYFDAFYEKLKKDFLRSLPAGQIPPDGIMRYLWIVGRQLKRVSAVIYLTLAILAAAVGVLGFIALNQPFTATVQVYGWKGLNHTPLQNVGTIELTLGDKVERAEINRRGEAIFKQVPSEYRRRQVRIHLADTQGEPYYLLDSVVVLDKKEKTFVETRLEGLDMLQGTIIDSTTEEGLPDATVSVAGMETRTDSLGRFKLNISDEKQEKEQEINVHKEGYGSYRNTIPMMGKHECHIFLHKNNSK